MMTPRVIARITIWPWIVGVVLSVAAMYLGYGLGSETARVLGGEPGIWARMGKGLVWGGVIAGLQWPVVRTIGVLPIRFCVASAVGFAIGYPLGQTFQLILASQWSLHWLGYGSALATFGLFLGLPQWWILRRQMQRAGLWILFSMMGWMLTGGAWIGSGAGDGLDAVLYGIVTGPGLVWLVRSQRPNVAVIGS